MKQLQAYFNNMPLVALIAANSVPLLGVLFLEWDVFMIVLLYWSENVVIGFYNVLKMATVKMSSSAEHLGKLFMIPFFVIHYGGFTGGHGVFVLTMFERGDFEMVGGGGWPCFLVFIQILLNAIKHAYSVIPTNMKFAILALFISHGVSFVYNYLLKGEYAIVKLDKLMSQPYGRVVVMHIAIIAGGFMTVSLGSPIGLLLMLVVLKTVLDVKLHLKEHRKAQGNGKCFS